MRSRLVIALMLLAAAGSVLMAQTLVIETNRGEIEVQLLPDVAPQFTSAFLDYVRQGAFSAPIVHSEPSIPVILIEPDSAAAAFPVLPSEVNPAALGLDTLRVRHSWSRGLVPASSVLQDSSVAVLMRRMGRQFADELPSLHHTRGALSAVCNASGSPTGAISIVLADKCSRWMDGTALVFGHIDTAELPGEIEIVDPNRPPFEVISIFLRER